MPGLGAHEQVLRGPAWRPLLRGQRGDRQDREPLQVARPPGLRPRRETVGRERAAVLRQPRQFRGVHGPPATSIYFESLPYKVHPVTGLIDFDELRKSALLFRPALIICGASAYPRVVDFGKFKEIADEVGALLMADMAHISGLVATGLHPAPFEHCDVVTTTTHKSLRGPRAGMIFFKYCDQFPDIKERIDMAVFPALQGGPHNHQIGALASQLLEVNTPAFKEYSKA